MRSYMCVDCDTRSGWHSARLYLSALANDGNSHAKFTVEEQSLSSDRSRMHRFDYAAFLALY